MRIKRPCAYVTVEDMACVVDEMLEQGSGIEEVDEMNDLYSSDEDSDDERDEFCYIPEDEMPLHKGNEQRLANATFVHGMSYRADFHAALATMKSERYQGGVTKIKGIFLDNCANRSSVMYYNQYKAYCNAFHVPCHLEQNDIRKLTGIGGTKKAVGLANIPILFKDLQFVIDVQLQIILGNRQSLLSMKNLIEMA